MEIIQITESVQLYNDFEHLLLVAYKGKNLFCIVKRKSQKKYNYYACFMVLPWKVMSDDICELLLSNNKSLLRSYWGCKFFLMRIFIHHQRFRLNESTIVKAYSAFLDAIWAVVVFAEYDVVVDCSDNPSTRFAFCLF